MGIRAAAGKLTVMSKSAELVFTDLPEAISVSVPEYMEDVPLRWTIVEPGCVTPQDVIAAATGAKALIPFYAPIPRLVIESLPDLRIVALPYVGPDLIDLEAAAEHKIWVTNVPDGNRTEVASHTLALMLSLLRGLPAMDRGVREGNWHYLVGGVLHRCTTLKLGVLGCGGIGRQVASFAKPLFSKVLGCDPWIKIPDWPQHIERVEEVSALFRQADVITVHVPLTAETRNLVNAELLSMLKPGSYLINAARGPVVEAPDLIDALDRGSLAGAALDVFPVEPPALDDPLLKHPKIQLSPHAAAYSEESREETMRRAIQSAIDVLGNRCPMNVVVEGVNPT